jgi:alkylation response protein AidB-like acyl-CoA dehydrogenase
MDFSLSDEQVALQASVQRFLDKAYGFETRRAIERSGTGWSREVWQGLADLGALGINVPQEHGGLGCGPVETMIVMNLCGRYLLLEPYLASAIVATAVLRDFGAPGQRATWLPRLTCGQTIAALAHLEPESTFDRPPVNTCASVTAEGDYVLKGQKALVEHATAADVLLVSARIGGSPATSRDIGLFLVPRETPGMTLRGYRMLDGRVAADITLESVRIPSLARIGTAQNAMAAIERGLEFALAALCAEAVGAMHALMDASVSYLKNRQQFGRPIGSFQVLQHRAADMQIALEQARSMVLLATSRCTDADSRTRQRSLSATKVVINRAGRYIAQQAVQLHGAMGMTDELQVSHWFKRLTAIEMTLGSTDTHLHRFAASGPI